MEVTSIQTLFENLEKKLSDQEWVKTQDEEFVKLLTQVSNVVQNLSAQVYIFISLYQQYVQAMEQSPIFSPGAAPSDEGEHGNVSPTQTSAAAPANREQRRAKEKQDKKLLVPEKKLIVP
jgi:hypothetical protein